MKLAEYSRQCLLKIQAHRLGRQSQRRRRNLAYDTFPVGPQVRRHHNANESGEDELPRRSDSGVIAKVL